MTITQCVYIENFSLIPRFNVTIFPHNHTCLKTDCATLCWVNYLHCDYLSRSWLTDNCGPGRRRISAKDMKLHFGIGFKSHRQMQCVKNIGCYIESQLLIFPMKDIYPYMSLCSTLSLQKVSIYWWVNWLIDKENVTYTYTHTDIIWP